VDSFRLFFSNRSADQARVDDLQVQLRGLLPNLPFVDVSRDVPFTDDWKTPARSILESCDALICVVGPETHSSEPIDWEIREARRLGKPLVIARVASTCRLPPCCEELHIATIDWDTAQVAGHVGELLVSRALFSRHDWGSGSPDPAALWNQYNLMVQSWESLITRRQTVNTLYVSAAAALLAGVGILVSSIERTGISGTAGGTALLAALGAALSFNWRRTIVSYGILSRAKSKVIAALEAHMPAQLFDAEWRVLEAKRYKSTTETDTQTAFIFMLLFGAIALVSSGIALLQLA
jgi:hypothetical protein